MAFIKFLKPKNQLEEGGRTSAPLQRDEGEPEKKCPNCHKDIPLSRLWANDLVCACGYHFRMKARQRIKMLTDREGFHELYSEMKSLKFSGIPGQGRDCAGSQRRGGSGHLRNGQDRKTELLPVCDGALFYDGQHGKRCGRENHFPL